MFAYPGSLVCGLKNPVPDFVVVEAGTRGIALSLCATGQLSYFKIVTWLRGLGK